MRHSDQRLTNQVYTDTSHLDVTGALESLPAINENKKQIEKSKENVPLFLPPDLVKSSHNLSFTVKTEIKEKTAKPAPFEEKREISGKNEDKKVGSGCWIRTSDQVVNSHLLYR